MYQDGYDFIHFATMSIPVMLIEVLVRLGYACRRLSQGASLSDTVAFSTNRKNIQSWEPYSLLLIQSVPLSTLEKSLLLKPLSHKLSSVVSIL